MAAEDLLLFVSNHSCERHHVKGIVDLGKHRVWVFDVISKSASALCPKPEVLVYVPVFVVSSEEEDLIRELQLQSEKQADNLKAVLPFINVVSKEQEVVSVDVLGWRLPDFEESHQVDVLPVYISEDFGWRLDVLEYYRLM